MLYLCYIDESGTSSNNPTSNHFVLCGLSIPVKYWKTYTAKVNKIRAKYNLRDVEIHAAYLLRSYREQAQIPDFENLNYQDRKEQFKRKKHANLSLIKRQKNFRAYKQERKFYKRIEPYIHLTYKERCDLVNDIADLIGNSKFIRIFAECVDKTHAETLNPKPNIDKQSIEQLVSRFEHYMSNLFNATENAEMYGILIHDRNGKIEKNYTELLRKFHKKGTTWTKIDHVVETPFFVDSELNTMIQMADICALALRRYFDNIDRGLFDKIRSRFDKRNQNIVGIRHFTNSTCNCEICSKKNKISNTAISSEPVDTE